MTSILYTNRVFKNKAVNALSRVNHLAELIVLSKPGIVDVETTLKEVEEYDELQKIISELKENPEEKQHFQ